MTVERSELAGRLIAELAIIVVGVLIALAAQSLAQELSERREEQEFIVDLLVEFKTNELQLLSDIEQTKEAVDAADLWRAGESSSPGAADDFTVNPYATSLNPARFDPISGSLRSLIDGGDLGLIQNRELRAALAGWNDRTQEQVMTSVTVDMMRSMLMQFLIPEGTAAPDQALQADRLLLQVTYDQQLRLLGLLREIIVMLQEETAA